MADNPLGKRLWIIGLFLILLLLPASVFSQERVVLSEDPAVFIKQISEILHRNSNDKIKDKSRKLVPDLEKRWEKGRFNKAEKAEIRKIAQALVDDKLTNNMAFFEFFYIVDELEASKWVHDNLTNYLICTNKLYKKKGKDALRDHLAFTDRLLKNNVLNVKSSQSWCLVNARFRISDEEELKIVVERGDLACVARGDSSIIKNTNGVFVKRGKELLWKGNGGTVSWRRFKMGDQVYAKLSDYSINLANMEYVADSVILYDKKMLDDPVVGKLHDKALLNVSSDKADYPLFVSYSDEYEMRSKFKNVSVKGAVGLRGKYFTVFSSALRYAEMTIWHADSISAEMSSNAFVFNEHIITSKDVSMKMRIRRDSVFNSGLSMRFDNDKREIMFYNIEQGSVKSPYIDTYHNTRMMSEAMYWKIDEDELRFNKLKSPNNENAVRVNSQNYFNRAEFEALQRMDEVNPMYIIERVMKQNEIDFVSVGDVAQYIRMDRKQAYNLIKDLVNHGYLIYDQKAELAHPTKDFYLAVDASKKKIDYDVININSVTTNFEPNIVYNMSNNDLKLNGVDDVYISSYLVTKLNEKNEEVKYNKNLEIRPYDKSLTIKKDFEMLFSGSMEVGQFTFYIRDGVFDYDNFLMDLPQIDSVAFRNTKGERVDNVIANCSGVFYINDKNNKSGIKTDPKFPLFDSNKECYVYFDKKKTNQGMLDRKKFMFIIPNFHVEGAFAVEDFDQHGTLHSSIFPDIEETLVIMTEDNSLGFNHQVEDEEQSKIYNGKATFVNRLHLSNSGFYGDGSVNFMTTYMDSNRFNFYLDSLNCTTYRFEMLAVNNDELPLSYPYTNVDEIKVRINMQNDKMHLNTIKHPLRLYDNSNFTGYARLDSTAFIANGRLNVDKANVISKYFVLKIRDFTADSSRFAVNDDRLGEAFVASHYRSYVNYDTRQSSFAKINDKSILIFPLNKMTSNQDNVEWYMDENRISMSALVAEKGKIVSTNAPDSKIVFTLTNSEYNLSNLVLTAHDTKRIDLADARVKPPLRDINIKTEARIDTISESTIIVYNGDITKKETFRHDFHDAIVRFDKMNYYHATGYLVFDTVNGKRQFFEKIWSDSTHFTKAISSIKEEDDITIHGQYKFRGKITLVDKEKKFALDGDFKINDMCGVKFQWLKSYADINQLFKRLKYYTGDLYLQIEPDDWVNTNSVYFDHARRVFNSVFLSDSTLVNPDIVSTPVKGSVKLRHNNEGFKKGNIKGQNNSFFIADKMILDGNKCEITVQNSTYDMKFGTPLIDFHASGVYKQIINTDNITLELDTKTTMTFPFDKKLMDILAKKFFRTNDTLRKVSKDATNLTFDKVTMKWDERKHCFVSEGTVNIKSVMGRHVSKVAKGYLVLDYNDGFEFTLYLAKINGHWVYFNYKEGKMYSISSLRKYNNRLSEIKKTNRVSRKQGNRYEYMIGNTIEKDKFLTRMSVDYKRE